MRTSCSLSVFHNSIGDFVLGPTGLTSLKLDLFGMCICQNPTPSESHCHRHVSETW